MSRIGERNSDGNIGPLVSSRTAISGSHHMSGLKGKGGCGPLCCVLAPFGQCVGDSDVARPPLDIRPPEVGLAGCAQGGAEKASAATTATPVRRCFMGVDPPSVALSGPVPTADWVECYSIPLAHAIRDQARPAALLIVLRISRQGRLLPSCKS